jgi:hypothetical protein
LPNNEEQISLTANAVWDKFESYTNEVGIQYEKEEMTQESTGINSFVENLINPKDF